MVNKREYESMITCLNYAYGEISELKKELYRVKTELKAIKCEVDNRGIFLESIKR